MKKMLTIALLSLATAAATFAQSIAPQVLAASGGSFEGSAYSVYWTIGQPGPVQTTPGSVFYLTQGFQQPAQINVGLSPLAPSLMQLEAFPNPASGFVNVKGLMPFGHICRYVITDMNGRVLLTGLIAIGPQQRFETRIGLQLLPSGAYVFTLLPGNSGNRPLGSLIINHLVQ